MKAWLKRLAGANRKKVIAVIAVTREDALSAIVHANTSGESVPVWVWCLEPGEAPAACERYAGGATATQVLREMHRVWPALSITGWTGRRLTFATLLPFVFPPLRIVIFNEAHGFSAAKPSFIASHVRRRLRDAAKSAAIRAGERTRSIAFRSGERIRDVFLWIWNFALACAAFCAPVAAPLVYAAMKRKRAGGPSSIEMPPALSGGCIDIEVSARAWRRGRFIRALTESEAPFVALHRGPVNAAHRAELIELARLTDAFAVARQDAFTGWRKRVVSKHPFRALQQGEVSPVLAPHSSLVVMRRDMLLQLGVPRAITNGAALTGICYAAASAGLVSLTLGTGRELAQEPAMPLEDAEFVFHLPELTAARPAETRGNIACCPGLARPMRGKTSVLVVSPYLPYPLSHGGAVRMYNLCRSLCGEVDFTLVCFREAGERVAYEELHRVFRSVYVIDIDEKHPDPSVPDQVAAYRNSAMTALISRLCSSGGIDILQLEYTQMAEYREQACGVPVILVEHDITFTLHRQISDTAKTAASRQQYELWLAFERTALRSVNTVWTMSAQDRNLAIESGAASGGVRLVPNGVDLARFHPQPRPPGPPAILFVGSFRHLPNLLAFELLRDAIMPVVWQHCPDALLHVIAGPHHDKAAKLAGKSSLLAPHPRIHMQGYVEDVRTAYRDCDAVAVPLPISAGTNIKVMEAMACGRAVVSTTVGCQGLNLNNSEDIVVVDHPRQFAEALLNLLLTPEPRSRMSAQARRTVEQRFGWDAIAPEALESYKALSRSRAVA